MSSSNPSRPRQYDENTSSEAPTSSISIAMSAMVGTVVGGAAVALLLIRGGGSGRASSFLQRTWQTASRAAGAADATAAAESRPTMMEEQFQDLRREMLRDLSSAESRLASRLDSLRAADAAADAGLRSVTDKVDELRTIFASPQRRGAFGEIQLEAIIGNVLPPSSYEFQYTLSNRRRVDCLIKFPPPIGNLAVDSKFPMDAFLELTDATSRHDDGDASGSHSGGGVHQRSAKIAEARKRLGDHVEKHVRDISQKYIIPGETADSAILFLPSESVFAEVVTHNPDVIAKAHRSKVWITCPTTLMAVLATIQGAVRGVAVSERAELILGEVEALSKDVERLVQRGERVESNFDKMRNDLDMMKKSIEKVQKRKIKLDVLQEGWYSDGPATSTEDIAGKEEGNSSNR